MSWTFYDANGTLLQGLAANSVTSAHIVDGTIVTADLGNITGLDSTSTITLDATTDIVLDADGADILLKDGGTDFGGFTNTSGNLIIKSGTTTALTFSGANATAAGTVASGAITSTGVVTGTTVEATADTSAGDNAAIGYTAAEGLILTGQGSTNDITIKNDADAAVISIPTGTTGVTFAGTTSFNGVAYTWPGSDGASGASLQTNASGTLSWTVAAAGVSLGLVIALGG